VSLVNLNFFPTGYFYLAGIGVIIVTLGVFRAVLMHVIILEMDDSGLAETLNGKIVHFMRWEEITRARIQSTQNFAIFKECILYIYSHKYDQAFSYHLSELAEADIERVVLQLRVRVPNLEEY
jgi:hypothetical protein